MDIRLMIAMTVATLIAIVGVFVTIYFAEQLQKQRDQVHQMLLEEKGRSQTLGVLLAKAIDGFAPGLTWELCRALGTVRTLPTPEGRMEQVKSAFRSFRSLIHHRCLRANDMARRGMCEVIRWYFTTEVRTLNDYLKRLPEDGRAEVEAELTAVYDLLGRNGVDPSPDFEAYSCPHPRGPSCKLQALFPSFSHVLATLDLPTDHRVDYLGH